MNLAKHTKQTAVPKAPICGTGQLSSYVSASSLTNAIEALSNKRVKAVSCLSDKNVQISLASAIDAIIRCVRCNRKIMIAGNGGSASQSQHFCSELMGRYKDSRLPIRAVSLCSDVSLLTCVANDFGYERIFSRQIEGIGDAEDLFIAFTTSGKSRNILEALCECKSRGVQSLVLTGNHHDAISKLADIVISVPVDDPAIVQEIHLQMIHIMCETIEQNIDTSENVWERVLALGRQDYQYLILDRDGVINQVKANGYILSPSEFKFRQDFVAHAIELSETFCRIFVVSNQKGVGKGLLTSEDLRAVHNFMDNEIRHLGGRIDKIYVSTSADSNAPTSKPNTGMADLIKKDFPEVDFSKTIVVGDSATDYLFADNLKSKFVYVRTR